MFSLSLPSPALLRVVSRFDTDVSGPHISPIFSELICRHETSVLNQITTLNNPED